MTHFIQNAKTTLGIDRLVLQIQDASFPADPEENLGRGSPYSRGAERFFRFASHLGFDTIQLGPRGMTGRGNASPYDGTLFSRNPLDLPWHRFVEQGRLSRQTFDSLRASLPFDESGHAPYASVFDVTQIAASEVIANVSLSDRASAREFLAANESWLVPDALYAPLGAEHGHAAWTEWGHSAQGAFDQRLFHPPVGQERASAERLTSVRSQYAQQIEDYALIQWLLRVEHQSLRAKLSEWKLELYGDMQVGMSLQDAWAWQKLFLPRYRMGAPPSRTNPDGQPWGYTVLDPQLLGTLNSPGLALEFVRARIDKVLDECDGLRIDHPHGWVDPWVYGSGDPDPFHAVQNGARLYSSPDDPQHPDLSRYSIARPEQIDRQQPGYADQRVTSLDEGQVARYSLLFDLIRDQQTASGRPGASIACEVLSTLPDQLRHVLVRHQMGRFRVTQKIKLDTPSDVYRIEHAEPADWIMLGTHDTPAIWQLAPSWCQGAAGPAWGDYLARQLVPDAEQVEWRSRIAGHPGELIHALFAAMLGSRARQVVIFFPDLFGMTERYNEPGIVNTSNWSLRLPTEFEELYEQRCLQGAALDLTRCFQMAMKAQSVTVNPDTRTHSG